MHYPGYQSDNKQPAGPLILGLVRPSLKNCQLGVASPSSRAMRALVLASLALCDPPPPTFKVAPKPMLWIDIQGHGHVHLITRAGTIHRYIDVQGSKCLKKVTFPRGKVTFSVTFPQNELLSLNFPQLKVTFPVFKCKTNSILKYSHASLIRTFLIRKPCIPTENRR